MEAMDGPGDVSAPTLIVQFGKGSGAKTTQQSSKAAVQKEGNPVNAAKVQRRDGRGRRKTQAV